MFPEGPIAREYYPHRNFASISAPYSEFEQARVVVLPVLYDSTTDWRSGARDGPPVIIDASQYVELYDLELDMEIYKVGIHTLPEVQPVMSGPEKMLQRVYRVVKDLIKRGKMVVMLGGEHSLTLGAVRAYREKFPELTVLQLDAHADLRDEYLGTRFSHASAMRRVMELCPIVQVGIRSMSYDESLFIKEKGLEIFYAHNTTFNRQTINKIVSRLKGEVYITIDADVFDPGLVPAVGTPEPGGLGWYETISLLKEVTKRCRVVGFDVVELCPREGPVSSAFFIARLIYKLIGLCYKTQS